MTLLSLAVALASGAPAPPADLCVPAPLAEPWIPAPVLPVAQEEQGGSLFSYTFVEVGASARDVDDLSGSSDDVDIYYGRASLGVFDPLYLFAGYQNQATDFQNTDSDVYSLGVGAHAPLSTLIDLTGEIAWLYNDVSSDLSTLDDSSNGYQISAGLRWMPWSWAGGGIELDGGAIWVDIDNRLASDDAGFGWGAGARLHFLRFLSIGGAYSIIEDDDQVIANVRLSF